MSLSSFLVSVEIMAISANPIAVVKGLIEAEKAAADFIQNGPSTGLPGYARDQYRKRCNQFGNLPPWARALAGGPLGGLGRVCKPYLDASGKDSPQETPSPLQGGQCPTLYRVRASLRSASTGAPNPGNPVTIAVNMLGPLTFINGSVTVPECIEGQTFYQTKNVRGADGQLVGITGQGCSNFNPFISMVVTLMSGGADTCGNLPPTLEPGPNPPDDPGPTPGPEPTADPRNPTGVPLLPIPDYEDPIGGPTPVVAPEDEPSTIGPENIPGSFDTQPGGAENVGEPIEVDPSGGPGGDGTDFGVPPSGRAWIGCLLRFNFPSEAGAIAGSGPTNPVSPRTFGNASLVFEGGLGTAHRVNSGSMSVIRDSGALKVTGVYVNVLPGFTYSIRPISVELCPPNLCGEP